MVNDSKSMKYMYLPMRVWKWKWYRSVLAIMNQKGFFQLLSSLRKMVEVLEGISEYQCIQIPVVAHTKLLSKQKNLYIHSLKHTFYFCSVLGRSE